MLIKNGYVIDPANQIEEVMDILIENGKIIKVAKNIEADTEIIDATNKWVIPGAIDLHVHFREPGFTNKENIMTGAIAAAKGGVTTVCNMPNTNPIIDNADTVIENNRKASDAVINVLQVGSITKGQKGIELADIEEMLKAGICAISEDGKSVKNSNLLRQAMNIAAKLDLPMFSHCEDIDLASGCMNEGIRSKELGLNGIPNVAEDIIATRNILLKNSLEKELRLHLCHVSTKESVEIIKFAKIMGIKVTAETCPHYFTYTEDDVDGKNTSFKMNPPLRTKEDKQAIIDGLKDGTIDVIATDHAPHTKEEKSQVFEKAPNGIVGLETMIPVIITELINKNIITPKEMVEKISLIPAKILGTRIMGGIKGNLKVSADADITIIDPNVEYIYEEKDIVSKSSNSPFIGKKLTGKVVSTIVNGKKVF